MDALNDRPSDEDWMARARDLAVARKGTDPANTPIAAIIVRDGQLLSHGVNRTAEHCDATAHAEVMAQLEQCFWKRHFCSMTCTHRRECYHYIFGFG